MTTEAEREAEMGVLLPTAIQREDFNGAEIYLTNFLNRPKEALQSRRQVANELNNPSEDLNSLHPLLNSVVLK